MGPAKLPIIVVKPATPENNLFLGTSIVFYLAKKNIIITDTIIITAINFLKTTSEISFPIQTPTKTPTTINGKNLKMYCHWACLL